MTSTNTGLNPQISKSLLCNTALKTLTGLAFAGMLSACGGSSSSVPLPPPAADTTAPVISFSASKTDIEGGETVAINLSATDNVDANVSPTFTCDGGTVNGTLLVTERAEAAGTITCTATATDSAGNSASQNLTINVGTSQARLSSSTASFGDSVAQGGIVAINVDNLDFNEGTYTATLNGVAIDLLRPDEDTIGFVLPVDQSVGDAVVDLTIGDKRYSFAFDVTALATIDDPKGVVVDKLQDAISALDDIIASSMTTSAEATGLSDQRTSLQDALDTIDSFSEAEILQTAQFLVANPIFDTANNTNGATARSKIDLAACESAASTYTSSIIRTVAVIGLIAVGTQAAIVSTGLVGAVAGGVAGALFIGTLQGDSGPVAKAANVASICVGDLFGDVESDFSSNSTFGNSKARDERSTWVKAVSAEGVISFVNNEPKQFTLTGSRSFADSVADVFLDNIDTLINALNRISFIVPDSAITALNAAKVVERDDIAFDEIVLSEISNTNITGALSNQGEQYFVTFNADDVMTTSDSPNIDFSFNLSQVDGEGETVDAQISVLPSAQDAQITVEQGVPTSAALKIDNAESLRIVEQPSLGSVVFNDNNSFEYTPNGLVFGKDQFTYEAVNSSGVSAPAVVMVDIVRVFEGAYAVDMRFFMEDPTNLCGGDIDGEFVPGVVTVTKLSDLDYRVQAGDTVITTSLASIDDPAGLLFSFDERTVNQVTGDFKTEERDLGNISVPDSRNLDGIIQSFYREFTTDSDNVITARTCASGTSYRNGTK